jgi:hypothetical protein
MFRPTDIILIVLLLVGVSLLGGCGAIDRYLTDARPRPQGDVNHLREFEFRNSERRQPYPPPAPADQRGHILDPVCDAEIMPKQEGC